MCGIVGIVRFDGRSANRARLERMVDLIAHRGPDDAGLHVDGAVGLGHRRLSIVDLSPAGHQPMASADGKIWIVFNGEIYNHGALRDRLIGLGHTFRSTTDTEVIVAAWRQWGADCVAHFEGMWAFALWDACSRRLFCSRDRLGIKPFYYALTNNGFAFGSEIKSVLASGLPRQAVQRDALRLQLVYRARTNNQTTCFEDILQLPPAHNAELVDGRLSLHRYWDAHGHSELHGLSNEEYARRYRETLEAAVDSHLRGDVPVGACLSGGLDSATLVALAAPRTQSPLRTFSITYPGTPQDESIYIHALLDKVANLAPAEHVPTGADVVDMLERTTWHYEEPVWGGSVCSWWQVMKLVHEHGIKVVLNGQGADELLAGYPRYYPTYLRELLFGLRIGTFWRNFRGFTSRQREGSAAVLRDLATPFLPVWARRVLRAAGRGRAFDDRFLSAELRAPADAASEAAARRAFRKLDEHLLSDLVTTRLPELLQAEDRFSMAFSIESRVPFLDRKVVEFALELPASQKLDAGTSKCVQRNAMRNLIPDITIDRRDKQGYDTPADRWLRDHAIDFAGDLFGSRSFRERGVFDAAATSAAFERWRTGEERLPQLWTWLSTEIWYRQYLDAALPAVACGVD